MRNDQFIKWVIAPDEETTAYWENWMRENPDEVETILKAREIARDLAHSQAPTNDITALSAIIWEGIENRMPAESSAAAVPLRHNRSAWYWMAASLLGLLVLSAGIYFSRRAGTTATGSDSPRIASLIIKGDLERVNQTSLNQVVYLVDGSKVILEPGSRIRHATFLQKDRREVYLEGNAFFDVARDAARPFYVNTKDLEVKVLGTSFTMTADRNNGDVTVIVHTGKIAVSARKRLETTKEEQEADTGAKQLILTQNQKALFRAQTHVLLPAAADQKDLSVALTQGAPALSFNFEETPVLKIFKSLEDAYGIPFYYDEKMFAACVITTSLGEETFEEKLTIICEAIGAEYRIDHNGVYIKKQRLCQ